MMILITIPAYNEEKTLGRVLEEIKGVMDKTSYKYKILVYNDGSVDKTVEVAKKHGALVVSHKRNQGLAQTFKDELEEAVKLKPDIIVHTDADGQYFASDIPRMIEGIERGYDLILGSRFRGKIRGMSLVKKLGNMAFAMVFSHLVKRKITDTTTGFRAFTLDVAREIKIINNFTYTQEQIIRARKQNFKIAEIPINTRKTRESRLFKSPLEYAIKAWINILRIYRDYNPIRFFGRIGAVFLAMATGLGLYFVFLHFTTGIKGHLGLLFLMLLLFTSGIQIALFGLLADMNKK